MSANTNESSPEPSVALLGDLGSACKFLAQKDFQSACKSTLEALQNRPHHPEAYLLLGRIAFAMGDGVRARQCAEKACELAPGWQEPELFLKSEFRNGSSLNWPGLDELLATGTGRRLTVCLIVKNEEAFLEKCLSSVRACADQIIVVDTGSTDRTVEIALKHRAEVYHHVWNDDFSAARNAALVHARGDWILAMDADEELMEGASENLLKELGNAKAIAYHLPLLNAGRESEGCTYVPRLFRNVPGAYYEGRVHEQVFRVIMLRAREWGMEVSSSQAQILHHGYTAQVTASREKAQRNLRLLRQAHSEKPEDTNILMNLGLETARLGNLPEGLVFYERALELVNRKVESNIWVSPEFGSSLLQQMATYYTRSGRYEDVFRLFQSPLAKSIELSASDHFALGLACGETKRYEQSIAEFRACLAKRHLPTRIPIKPGILGAAPFHCLAVVMTRMSKMDEVVKIYEQGIAEMPDSLELRMHYARFKFGQGRALDALRDLNGLLKNWGSQAEVWILGGEICLSHPQFFEVAMDWTGEAVRFHPGVARVLGLRAECLLVACDLPGASQMLSSIQGTLDTRSQAVAVICDLLGFSVGSINIEPALEPQVSRAFVEVYGRIAAIGAMETIARINGSMAQLQARLPSAAGILRQMLPGLSPSKDRPR